MVHSNWDDWFLRNELEGLEINGFSIWYLGGNGFVLRTAETTVYLDPYFGDSRPPTVFRMIPVPLDPADANLCDAVLSTHEHLDHFHPPSFGPLVEELGADVYAPKTAFEDPDYDGELCVPEKQRITIKVGDTFEVGDLTVYVRDATDPDAVDPVSFVIEHETGTFFNAGDSRDCEVFGELGNEFDIDVGALAFGTSGRLYYPAEGGPRIRSLYMSENELIAAANALEIERLVPCHHDIWKGVMGDPKVLEAHAASFGYPKNVEVMTVGDRIDMGFSGVAPFSVLADSRHH